MEGQEIEDIIKKTPEEDDLCIEAVDDEDLLDLKQEILEEESKINSKTETAHIQEYDDVKS